ncbi:cuticle protein AMP1A-like [Scylla paramamosain]|uniref:cuticle protein AMP1A-like n=1 Tax=Scylla paramamosain TaxID=85552 RepID=UPI00308373CC
MESLRHRTPGLHLNMKLIVLAALAAVAVAAPGRYHSKEVPILKHDFIMEEDGRYHLEFETGNNIAVSQSGSPTDEGAIAKAGHFSYTAPDGTPVSLKFVANEHGFQPESDLLPVAPEFPHPIPQYVLDQIARAAEEDRNRSPEGRYTYA